VVDKSSLKSTFSGTLPGWIAQKVLCPPFRNEQLKINCIHKQEAAIGIILFNLNNELKVLFIERTNDGGPHSGQIAFPGGSKDLKDKSLIDTAYREIYEEIGIAKESLEYIGELSSLYIPVSQFLVYPYVFYCTNFPNTIINFNEIKALHVFPVIDFYKKGILTKSIINQNNCFYEVPCFVINNIIIWGATSMIWNECLTILKPLLVNE